MAKNLFLQLCEELQIPHTRTYTNRKFDEHPYKYSLFGLSRMLGDYGVESRGVRFHDKESALTQLETPFVAQVSGNLALISHITGEEVSYRWYGEDVRVPQEQFLRIWSGVALLVAPGEEAGEPDFAVHHHAERIQRLKKWGAAGCIALGLVCCLFLRAPHFSLFTPGLFILNLLGLYVSYLLLLRQLKIASSTADRLCNLLKHSTCTDLLETPASKAAFGISWSEVGAAYFGVNALMILFMPSALPMLALPAFGALGYSAWSLWYQRFRAHAWCPLCLLVQAVFILQALVYLISSRFREISFDAVSLSEVLARSLLLLSSYLSATLCLHLALPVIAQARQAEQWKYNYRNLKLREEVFGFLLQKEPHYETTADSCIRFGNPDARFHLTVFTNPYCNPCAAMHGRMSGLIHQDCSIKFVFTSFGSDYERVSRLMVTTYLQLGAARAWTIYEEWYAGGKSRQEAFFEELGLDADSEEVAEEYRRHTQWREQTGLSATPTLLVNGYQMPKEYQIEDFIDLLKIEE